MKPMSSNKRILFLSNSFFASGAEKSLLEFVENNTNGFKKIIVLPKEYAVKREQTSIDTYYLPFKWFYKTFNPIILIQFVVNIILCSIYLAKLTRRLKIEYIYANTTKALIYAIVTKILTAKKIVWHVRDNKHSLFQYRLFTKCSDIIIPVSKYISTQIRTNANKVHVVYGGVDIHKWSPSNKSQNSLRAELKIPEETVLLATIGQLTSWKNHFDFIKVADLVGKYYPNTHFLIIGDNISGRENKYKTELKKKVDELQLNSAITFLGNRQDIKEILGQIDILVHPAINEPFGRVLVEAMAMEKPVIAYDCGGPKEIVKDNKTGYLVKTYDYKALAEKTINLLRNENLRIEMGNAGRRRVIEKFNIERYRNEIEELFDQP